MKKFLVASLFCVSTIANAQKPDFVNIQKPVLCGPVEAVMRGLADPDINEQPIWLGKDDTGKSDYVLFSNTKTKTFTLVQFGKEVACILGIGNQSSIIPTKPTL